ncbi:hypothetical protein EC988_000233 [Linderina pennispora]|nr:hypothetical protein EC988_000233 [Linderina pennispora]
MMDAEKAQQTDVPTRRFREIHYHRFPLGTRSNIHGCCLLRTHLPVRLPRPHTMQQIYTHPPPGVGYRRAIPSITENESMSRIIEHEEHLLQEIREERQRTRAWLDGGKAIARTHVVVATQNNLQFFIAGFGYWNVLDMNMHLENEACIGVKAFEVWAEGDQSPGGAEQDEEEKEERQTKGIESPTLPTLVVALTTHIKSSGHNGRGRYRLYAMGIDSLDEVPQEFIDRHAAKPERPQSKSSDSQYTESPEARPQSEADAAVEDAEPQELPGTASVHGEPGFTRINPVDALPMNSYAYLEERLFSLRVTSSTPCLDLDYLPYRISQDVIKGLPPILLVAGNDNRVHRYALGKNQIIELQAIVGPRTSTSLTFTVFDGRVIGPYHVQIMAQQEFVVTLQASEILPEAEAKEHSPTGHWRRLLLADEEVYDAAPILTTLFTPDSQWIDRTAYDAVLARKIDAQLSQSSPEEKLTARDIYDAEWPVGQMGRFPNYHGGSGGYEDRPRVHALVGFVSEEVVVYHDVPVTGLDPVPTLVGKGKFGSGLGGVFSLPGSAKEGMVTSVHFDDLDFDGNKEIMVGTVSGAVLIYKAVEGGYALVWKRQFPAPVYAIFSVDINCDGANELVVITLSGVHIMQPNLSIVRAKLLKQLILLRQQKDGKESE